MIRTDRLGMAYGRLPVLEQLSIHVEPGEIYGLIGPNGAGKTTTLRILATLLPPTAGDASIGGHSVRHATARARPLIGYMPDEPGPYEEMTAAGYLAFFAAAYHVPRARRDEVVARILELTDLAPIAGRRVEELSRGLQQRLSLARALVHDPAVLLLDEPASGLDPRGRLEMRELLRELQSMGKTILISSHLLAELAELCTRLALLDRGRLLFEGTLDQARQRAGAAPRLELAVASRTADAARLLEGLPEVAAVAPRDGRLLIELASPGQSPAPLARALIEGGFELVHFASREPDLEDVYLALTGEQ